MPFTLGTLRPSSVTQDQPLISMASLNVTVTSLSCESTAMSPAAGTVSTTIGASSSQISLESGAPHADARRVEVAESHHRTHDTPTARSIIFEGTADRETL